MKTKTRNAELGTRNGVCSADADWQSAIQQVGNLRYSLGVCAILVLLFLPRAAVGIEVAVQNDSAPVVLERGPHHKIVQTVSGGVYTELANGMHFIKDGQFVESQETILIDANGYGVADQGLHQARFAPSITDVPAVIYTDPD